ncbi:hypothetical protein BGZ73_006132 [Actinomortierella ambigua]|nr:hypothetical protein BGZ73_006132 [Actinomortierella ambigua]
MQAADMASSSSTASRLHHRRRASISAMVLDTDPPNDTVHSDDPDWRTSLAYLPPPSFAESELLTIQRRQINPRCLEVGESGRMIKWIEPSSSARSNGPRPEEEWEFAGWGSTYFLDVSRTESAHHPPANDSKIGVLRGIGIAGNDIAGSVFYTVGPAIVIAGQYSPFSFLLVSILLYPMKAIMAEVAMSLPFNGGAYVFLINICAKWITGIAATFSILDYMATSVTSAATATAYVAAEVTLPSALSVFTLTILVMVVFAVITFFGVRESSTVASTVFIFHLVTMLVLMVTATVRWIQQGNDVLVANWNEPLIRGANPLRLIWDGFCICLLGATGYEGVEGYLEELKPKTYPKIMTSMWVCITILNGPMAVIVLAIVPMKEIRDNPANALLALARYASGSNPWLRYLITVDAAIVLSAGVLTGMVGVLGLFERMSKDNILPPFLLIRNKWTGSYQYIIVFFLGLCVTLYSIVRGDTTSISGMFAVAFLCVLAAYSFSNLMLHFIRPRLPRGGMRRVPATLTFVVFVFTIGAIIGNAVIAPDIIETFFIYFAAVYIVFWAFMNRIWILRSIFRITSGVSNQPLIDSFKDEVDRRGQSTPPPAEMTSAIEMTIQTSDIKSPTFFEPPSPGFQPEASSAQRHASLTESQKSVEQEVATERTMEVDSALEADVSSSPAAAPNVAHQPMVVRALYRLRDSLHTVLIRTMIRSLRDHPTIYFTKDDTLSHLHAAIRYIRRNENSHKGNIRLVHIYSRAADIPERLEANHRFLDELYPKIQIDMIFIQGKFDPSTVDAISVQLKVPKSAMFVGCPGEKFPYRIEEFGGARIIMD